MATDRLGTGFQAYLENAAGGGVFTLVGDVLGGSWSGFTADDVEVTDTSNAVRQYIRGLANAGELTINLAYDGGDTVQEALQDEAGAGPTQDGKDIAIYHAGMDENWIFTGYIKGWTPSDYRPGEHMTATLVYKINTVTGPTSGAPSTS